MAIVRRLPDCASARRQTSGTANSARSSVHAAREQGGAGDRRLSRSHGEEQQQQGDDIVEPAQQVVERQHTRPGARHGERQVKSDGARAGDPLGQRQHAEKQQHSADSKEAPVARPYRGGKRGRSAEP